MLQLRSTPRATVSGNSPAANADIVLELIVLVHLEVVLTQTGHELALVVGDRRVDLDELHLRRKLRERPFLLRRGDADCAAGERDRRGNDEPSHAGEPPGTTCSKAIPAGPAWYNCRLSRTTALLR